MNLRQIQSVKVLRGKRVLLRLDLNVPLEDDGSLQTSGAWRIKRSLPTIKYLLKNKAKVIIVAHLGRPKGKKDPKLSLQVVCNYLSKELGKPIEFWSDNFSDYEEDSKKMADGSVAMLENIRFYPGEQKKSKTFAKQLSKLGDIYCNDAFGNIHREDASMFAITYHLPHFAGILVSEEVKNLSKAKEAKEGLVMIFGGAKAKTKLPLVQQFVKKAENILIGGVLANTFLKARDIQIGKSVYEKEELSLAKKLASEKIVLPQDVVVSKSLSSKVAKQVHVENVGKTDIILDMGPRTIERFVAECKQAKVVVWNGPLGYFENPIFKKGSIKLMKALSKTKAMTIVGGGETIELIDKNNLHDKFNWLSTGGGALITFLQGKPMPVLNRLKQK